MATVNIKLSQDTIDQQNQAELHVPMLHDAADMLADALAMVDDELGTQALASWALTGTTLKMTFADGATATYTGFAFGDPNAATGSAVATGLQFYKKGMLALNATGTLHYDYTFVSVDGTSARNLTLAVAEQGSAVGDLRIATEFKAGDAAYVGAFGNVSIKATGTLTWLPFGALSGTARNVTIGTEKYVVSASLDGAVDLALNVPSYFHGETENRVGGTVAAYKEDYADGSHFYVSAGVAGIAADALDDGWSTPASLSGADDINVDLPATLYEPFIVAAGAGDDTISINGGGGDLHVVAGAGNDTVTILGDEHAIDGGAGIDTVRLPGVRAAYVVQKAAAPEGLPIPATGTVYTVTARNGEVQTLIDVERIVFADKTVALDVDGNGGAAYRLYQAAFNRTPDTAGLGFWINAIDRGMQIRDVAQGFVGSAEFKTIYGSNPSNLDFVTHLYQNILHRAPEAGGLAFWTGVLDNKTASMADVLAGLSDSAENKAGLVGVIGNGFVYDPYGAS
ncbi:DUF4214 domain-containing protein [Massilia putida]|uniref:DUF4214 domain-containing protein n=1 Tax=Massilia putida TaxID=1141883 RepID=UPI0009524B76|nr:DUF4214 domain-containing protein [Massilia putida]